MKTVITCPRDPRFSLVCDTDEVFPEDPGMGTPAMVYGPRDSSATYNCAVDTGELTTDRDACVDIPNAVHNWLLDDDAVLAALATVDMG